MSHQPLLAREKNLDERHGDVLLRLALEKSTGVISQHRKSPASAGDHPGNASTAQAFTMILFALVIPVTALLWTFSRKSAGWMRYVLGAVLLASLWFASQMLIWAHWWYIDMPKLPREERIRNIFGMAATVLALHGFNLYATWRFRHR